MNITTERPPTGPEAVVSAFYEASLRGDLDAARPSLADQVVLHVPGAHALGGRHVGPDAVLRFVESSRHLTDDGEDVEILDVLASERRIAVYCRVTARRGDRRLDNTTVHLLHVDGSDRIDDIRLHNFDDVAVNDFWSGS
jgi:ketosteroid isomerase-like protein